MVVEKAILEKGTSTQKNNKNVKNTHQLRFDMYP